MTDKGKETQGDPGASYGEAIVGEDGAESAKGGFTLDLFQEFPG